MQPRFAGIFLALSGLASGAVTLGACMQDDTATKDRIDRLYLKAEALDRKLAVAQQGGGLVGAQPNAPAPPPPGPRPGQPDPSIAYSVPIDGDPVMGLPTAKVTIVEAADFA